MALNNLPQREEYLRKKRKKKIIKYSVIFSLTLLIICLFSYISHRPEIRVSKVELSGGVLVTQFDIEASSLSYLQGSYLWLFPKDNTFLYPRKKLEIYLKESFKRIDTVDIKRKDFQTITIEITERKPFAIWCDGIDLEEEVCFFMDQNSTIFAPAPNFSGDAYFKYYGIIQGDNPIGKEYIASTTEFLAISKFVVAMKGLQIRPLYVKAKSSTEFSLVVFGGGEIYFDTMESIDKIVENLSALLRTPELSTTTLGYLPVDYIDMRYGNKLFYKLKSE